MSLRLEDVNVLLSMVIYGNNSYHRVNIKMTHFSYWTNAGNLDNTTKQSTMHLGGHYEKINSMSYMHLYRDTANSWDRTDRANAGL